MTARAPECGGLLTHVTGMSNKGQREGHRSREGLEEWGTEETGTDEAL